MFQSAGLPTVAVMFSFFLMAIPSFATMRQRAALCRALAANRDIDAEELPSGEAQRRAVGLREIEGDRVGGLALDARDRALQARLHGIARVTPRPHSS